MGRRFLQRLSRLGLVAAAVLVPAPAFSQATREAEPSRPARAGGAAPKLSFGGFVGYESDTWDGWTLRADGEVALQPLAPRIGLSGVGSIGVSRLSADLPYASETVTILKVVPAARFSLLPAPLLALYGDAGLGLYYSRRTQDLTIPFIGVRSTTTTNTSLVARVGFGGFYAVNPQLRLGAEVDLMPYLGDLDTTSWSVMVGAMFGR